ncbi:IclR family transcriptional regulator [Alcaligenes endophyticus]|uniref:Helix-turn-helix domain-containing protein n=1 Tax=Alcaligenes endophyticus TaxID=1929088 RepID=A0ABT8EMY3_9BURK|nr:IclR family transcriptional regulator C-terminal domain-containing protein [Alcaligenes endophyticus]MCX5591452.1 helix-turn-helix domain-containing protein [Alcaligenes endophyticus]MDN4122667.1 helix-turn-helix domain-containing protein [Alcaligenes endophyticus]
MDTSKDTDTAGPRTLQRGLLLLKTLQQAAGQGLSVTELSRLTQLQRPTIYRLLAALIAHNLVAKHPTRLRYQALQTATNNITEQDSRICIMQPLMRQLAQETGDAVFLVVREGHESVSLWREIGAYPVQILATYAGKRQPLGVGSGSMAYLAKLDDQSIHEIIAHNAERLEQYGGMTQRDMWQLIENTRIRGYSVVGNYAVRGALGVGCAMCDQKGQPILALSITAITERMHAQRQKEIALLLRQALNSAASHFSASCQD